MNDSAAGSHPLNSSGADDTVVSHTVAMFDITIKHIGDCFNTAVRVPGKSLEVISRVV